MQGAGKDLGGVELVEGLTGQAVSASEPEGLFLFLVWTHTSQAFSSGSCLRGIESFILSFQKPPEKFKTNSKTHRSKSKINF